jgi:hypothetical protein
MFGQLFYQESQLSRVMPVFYCIEVISAKLEMQISAPVFLRIESIM